jgi:hypothetical protein
MDAVIRCLCLLACLFVCVRLPTAYKTELCAWHVSEEVVVSYFKLYQIFAYAAKGTHKTLTYGTEIALYISVEHNSVPYILTLLRVSARPYLPQASLRSQL